MLDILSHLGAGFLSCLQPVNLIFLVVGIVMGLLVGVLPGLTLVMGVVLALVIALFSALQFKVMNGGTTE